ncbi:MAG: hypothetical protein Q8L48_26830 [Archangium sp.]|nr:hypothetical protein [Archangium sp.]
MSEVDALFRLLNAAPPRSAEIVKRVTLAGTGFPALAALYGVDEARARVLVFRALLDVQSGGSRRVPDQREPVEVEAMTRADAPSTGEGAEVRRLWASLVEHREGLTALLDKAAAEFAASPDRDRDEWLRRLAIVLVLALTAYFWWREQTRPLPPPQKRPATAPVNK